MIRLWDTDESFLILYIGTVPDVPDTLSNGPLATSAATVYVFSSLPHVHVCERPVSLEQKCVTLL